ncbi:hypothetical protein KSX_53770 [Ktedonospora formicarum]|uniref:Uncharacterized protein n=1 Tax=Ktedonospora formicarum TaxID=2778364 RepID=A0A8J3I9M8_9CHLR|nr:hypothetical protein KSX_53770 [Ktedonospora formicarum]
MSYRAGGPDLVGESEASYETSVFLSVFSSCHKRNAYRMKETNNKKLRVDLIDECHMLLSNVSFFEVYEKQGSSTRTRSGHFAVKMS